MCVVKANFDIKTQHFFLKQQEVLKLVQKTKLQEIKPEGENQDFLERLVYIDFNNRGVESRYK